MSREKVNESLSYLIEFTTSRIANYRTEVAEYSPGNGYASKQQGRLNSTGEMRKILDDLDQFKYGAKIPQTFSSPDEFIEVVENYMNFLKSQRVKIDSEIELERTEAGDEGFISDYLDALSTMNKEVVSALEEAYDILGQTKGLLPKGKEVDRSIRKVLTRFDKVVQQIKRRRNSNGQPRPTLEVNDEYDVQDLLRGLLCLFFDDVREEEYTPSFAGASKRMDFLLKEEKIVIEVKKTRENLKDKQLGEELTIDIQHYQAHEDCKRLYCFVYDPGKYISNTTGLISDLEKQSTEKCSVEIIITT